MYITTDKKNNYIKLILYFFIFSFAGWILETGYCFTELGYFMKRGFLYGPICPIYGFGALILIIFLNKYKKHSFKLFLCASIICSAFEYIVGFALDALFSTKWWDYSSEILNLNGRISILFSVAWGVIAILFVNHFYPFFEKHSTNILKHFSFKMQKLVTFILLIIFVIDISFSCIKYLS